MFSYEYKATYPEKILRWEECNFRSLKKKVSQIMQNLRCYVVLTFTVMRLLSGRKFDSLIQINVKNLSGYHC